MPCSPGQVRDEAVKLYVASKVMSVRYRTTHAYVGYPTKRTAGIGKITTCRTVPDAVTGEVGSLHGLIRTRLTPAKSAQTSFLIVADFAFWDSRFSRPSAVDIFLPQG